MEAFGGIIWALATIVVPLALGALIAYEIMRRRRLRHGEREASAAATHEMYEHETEEPAEADRQLEENPPPFR